MAVWRYGGRDEPNKGRTREEGRDKERQGKGARSATLTLTRTRTRTLTLTLTLALTLTLIANPNALTLPYWESWSCSALSLDYSQFSFLVLFDLLTLFGPVSWSHKQVHAAWSRDEEDSVLLVVPYPTRKTGWPLPSPPTKLFCTYTVVVPSRC